MVAVTVHSSCMCLLIVSFIIYLALLGGKLPELKCPLSILLSSSATPLGKQTNYTVLFYLSLGGYKKVLLFSVSVREGDWNCPQCGNVNFSFRNVCNRGACGAPRPSPSPSPVSCHRFLPK